MSLIADYLAKVEADYATTQMLVGGAEDSQEIAQGESTLTIETIAQQQVVLDYLKLRRVWLKSLTDLLKSGVEKDYDEIPAFDVPQSVKDEIALKQAQMKAFSDLLRTIVVGADGGQITGN